MLYSRSPQIRTNSLCVCTRMSIICSIDARRGAVLPPINWTLIEREGRKWRKGQGMIWNRMHSSVSTSYICERCRTEFAVWCVVRWSFIRSTKHAHTHIHTHNIWSLGQIMRFVYSIPALRLLHRECAADDLIANLCFGTCNMVYILPTPVMLSVWWWLNQKENDLSSDIAGK